MSPIFQPPPSAPARFPRVGLWAAGALFWAGSALSATSSAEVVSTWREAADTLHHVTVSTSGEYPIVVSGPHIEGTGAFHLARPFPGVPEIITLDPAFAVSTDTRLFFESRLGWATTDQYARVEVSLNDQATWSTIWSRVGTGDSGQGAFERVDIPLVDFAGEIIRLRFHYTFHSGSYFSQTILSVGWLIDDIQIGTEVVIEPELFSIGEPSPMEQQMLEIVNRARADALLEAARLRSMDDFDVLNAVQFFAVDLDLMEAQFAELPRHLPPLAPNARLSGAARLHSLDMLENDFQGHVSSANPPHPLPPGASMSARLSLQGYEHLIASENVYSYARSVWHAHAGFNIDWGDSGTGSIGGMQDPAGHRLNIHSPDFREVGIGLVEGFGTNVGPLIVTQNFATESGRDQPFITGVAWVDVNDNGIYDPGEGIGGVVVTVEGERFYAVTAQAGGYAIPVSGDGTYTVTFSSNDFSEWSTVVTVQNDENVKLDFRPEDIAERPQVELKSFGLSATNADYWSLRVRTHGPQPILQTSTNLRDWTDLPVSPEDLGNGVYILSVQQTNEDVRFFRARLP